MSCGNQELSKKEVAANYYKARGSSNYNEIVKLISDSLTITEGDYVMPYNANTFYEVFKWDSIFQPSYEVIELEEKNQEVIASVKLSSIRNRFLKNDYMICKYKLSFNSSKINNIESLDCEGADWNAWEKERDSLVNWIGVNHPELNGFINDMTMQGAQNYLKAIEFYESKSN